ncbi:MAG TPA: YodL domain-containing protein [Ruminiclostridium sp.]|nr:YodL domain-containing protein [Ruminiclostridium sp.]
MNGISIKNDRIMFYGNTAGYIEGEKAVVDPMFQCEELKDYLTRERKLEVKWTNGVYDKLANSKLDIGGSIPDLKNCRIYQLKPEVNVLMKFIGYNELIKSFGEPRLENYNVVYDGQLETNDLESIFEKFNLYHPEGFSGHSLSISDVIELYSGNDSTYHYVDSFGFKEIDFKPPEQEQQNGQVMRL